MIILLRMLFSASLLLFGVVEAADLALKYNFEPAQKSAYVTAVVKPGINLSKRIQTAIIRPKLNSFRHIISNVQVVAARDYIDKQLLAPTISLSYMTENATKPNDVVVVAARNFFNRNVQLTSSAMDLDYVDTFTVGSSNQAPGFNRQSKSKLQRVELQITQNPLIGCAPQNINCSRTATDGKDITSEGQALTTKDTMPDKAVNIKKQRQQLTP
ncbi:MAG: hypothetical protein ACI9ES_003062 [Oceanospirillaceae bacterium]|jgi:hypothetical protein